MFTVCRNAVYERALYSNRAGEDPSGGELWGETFEILQCPSDSNVKRSEGRATYLYCVGDWPDKLQLNPTDTRNTRGVFCMTLRWNTMGTISDGTSNTIVFSERCTTSGRNTIKGSYAFSDTANGVNNDNDTATAGGIAVTPRLCLDRIDSSAGSETRSYSGGHATDHFGTRWADGRGPSQFSTILPPNSVSCVQSGNRENTADNGTASAADHGDVEPALISASSFHPGGVNACLVDGAVKFYSETIDYQGLNGNTTTGLTYQSCLTSGKSAHGLWGALGTRNGGESASP